jgi:glycosyltransferase involved in cell wall biosynthesis
MADFKVQQPVNNPVISIVIPVYNAEQYLPRCIDSVLAQIYKNYECILVDDGSTDSSPQICDEYAHKDNRIRVIHKKNGGLGPARNTGIDNSCGSYLFFLDSDDFISEDTLKMLYSSMGKADICAGNMCAFAGNFSPAKNQGKIDLKTHTKQKALKNIFLLRPPFAFAWGKLYKKELFNDVRYSDCLYEDVDIIYKLIDRCAEIRCINKICYFYNIGNAASITASRYGAAHFAGVANAKKMLNFVLKTYPECGPAAKYYFCQMNFHIYKRMLLSDNVPEEDKKEVKRNIRGYMLFALYDINSLIKSLAKIVLFFLGDKISCYFYRTLIK